MPNVSTSLRNDMINSAVNAVYQNVGSDRIKASDAAQRICDYNGDGWIQKSELKTALEQDRVVLSLREAKTGNGDNFIRLMNASDVATDVANRMDGADGRRDGYVDFNNKDGSDLFERFGALLGNNHAGVYAADLKNQLVSGDLVIGRQIRDRMSAKQHGMEIVELHQNKTGPKLVSGN